MSVAEKLSKQIYTVEEYLALERETHEKHEFYKGELFAMAGGSPNHTTICMNISSELHQRLLPKGCRAFNSEMKIAVQAFDLYTYADASMLMPAHSAAHRISSKKPTPSSITPRSSWKCFPTQPKITTEAKNFSSIAPCLRSMNTCSFAKINPSWSITPNLLNTSGFSRKSKAYRQKFILNILASPFR